MSQESSLTSPSDRNEDTKWLPQSVPSLTSVQTEAALSDLNITDHVYNYPKLERHYCDPNIMNQKIALVSFVPSQGAKADADGIYGMIKCRGNYATDEEANERAAYLIQNIDSYHKIYHCYVGRPFPATVSSSYSADTSEIDIRNKVMKVISEDVKQQKREEKKIIDDMKEREQNLLAESKRAQDDIPEDPIETYTTSRVKYAQLSWTYIETEKKMQQMKESIIRTRTELKEMDEEYPDFIQQYRDKYMKARTDAGIPDNDDSFVKYLGEDADLGF